MRINIGRTCLNLSRMKEMALTKKDMSNMRDKRIDGEYDPPLPKRIANPIKEEIEKLEQIIAKYERLAKSRKGDKKEQ